LGAGVLRLLNEEWAPSVAAAALAKGLIMGGGASSVS